MGKRGSRTGKGLWTVICMFLSGISGIWMVWYARGLPETSVRRVNSVSETKQPAKTSAAFYSLIGARQTISPDLRGNFWEWQLPDYPIEADLVYLSDGPCELASGRSCTVLPEDREFFVDQKCCVRTGQSWRHFMKHNPDKKWYFRGTHDTFVNVSALMLMLEEFESKIDPMKEFMFAFNFHEYNNRYYPQGGTGYLFSNYAVRKFTEKIDMWDRMCDVSIGDDVFLPDWFNEFGLNVNDYQTNKFIISFVPQHTDFLRKKQFDRVDKCPSDGYALFSGAQRLIPGKIREAVAIHMHTIPMNEAWSLMKNAPENLAVTFPNPNLPLFCFA